MNGTRYSAHRAPLRDVGVLLEARALHPGRSAYDHLLAQAQTQGIPRARVNELVEFVGLQDAARQRAGQFSLGMGQRLGIASALLGDPGTLILDEPINGLDPDGIHWMRGLLKTLAAEGRTVFLSSHLMSEMALTADHLIIIGRGRLIRDISVGEFVRESSNNVVRVRSPQTDRLRGLVLAHHATIAERGAGHAGRRRYDSSIRSGASLRCTASSCQSSPPRPHRSRMHSWSSPTTRWSIASRQHAGVTDAAGVAA